MSQFTLIYDSYCGWCYGAAPVLEQLLQRDVAIDCYHRWLFNSPDSAPLGAGLGSRLAQIDRQIASLTGQQFSQDYFSQVLDSHSEKLDSGLSAMAAALVRPLGAKCEMALAKQLQINRYIKGVGSRDKAAVIEVLLQLPEVQQLGWSAESLTTRLDSEPVKLLARARASEAQQQMQQLAVAGVPCLVKWRGEEAQVIDLGRYFSAPEQIVALID